MKFDFEIFSLESKLTALGVRGAASILSIIDGSTTLYKIIQMPEVTEAVVNLAVFVLVNARRVIKLVVAGALNARILLRVDFLSLEEFLTLEVANGNLIDLLLSTNGPTTAALLHIDALLIRFTEEWSTVDVPCHEVALVAKRIWNTRRNFWTFRTLAFTVNFSAVVALNGVSQLLQIVAVVAGRTLISWLCDRSASDLLVMNWGFALASLCGGVIQSKDSYSKHN